MMNPELAPKVESKETKKAELEALGTEKLKEFFDNKPELSKDSQSERKEKAREFLSKEEKQQDPEPAKLGEKEVKKPGILPEYLNPIINYQRTVDSLQRKLSPVSRSFSKIIHNDSVETASEFLEKTIMRPSVTLGATWTALIIGLIFYLTAKQFGYSLSGFELLGALIVGAIIGVAGEILLHFLKKRRK
jgi:hypothetical protein